MIVEEEVFVVVVVIMGVNMVPVTTKMMLKTAAAAIVIIVDEGRTQPLLADENLRMATIEEIDHHPKETASKLRKCPLYISSSSPR